MSVEPTSRTPGSDATADADPDARWLAALAGRRTDTEDAERGTPHARATALDDEAVREASTMREALRRWPPAVDPVEKDDPERIARLLERARIEGLLDASPQVATPRPLRERLRDLWRSGRFGPLPALAAMATVVVVIFVGSTKPSVPGDRAATEATVRSAADAVTLLTATDPQALRGEIADALVREGVAAARYQRFGRFGIDADLPSQPSTALRALLERYRIPVPADGVLRVEIEPRRP